MDIGELELRVPTVTEINEQLVEFVKEYVRKKASETLTQIASDENLPRDRLMTYIRKINFDDITSTIVAIKKPRKTVESKERCRARTSKGDRCTRKRKDMLLFCGSHETSLPYGQVDSDEESMSTGSTGSTGSAEEGLRSEHNGQPPNTKCRERAKPVIKVKGAGN